MHLHQIKGTKQFATFTFANGQSANGEFLLDDRETKVAVYANFQKLAKSGDLTTLHATLPTGDCISFLECIVQSQESHQVNFYPHFATVGRSAFTLERRIHRLGVVVDDFADIYYDFDAFGLALTPKEHIGTILEEFYSQIGRRVEVGDQPIIAYFTGRDQLFSARTPCGGISASHLVSYGTGTPRGINIKSRISTDLTFDVPVTLNEAIDNLLPVLRFLEIIAGRRQNLLEIALELDLPDARPGLTYLEVYWSSPPKRDIQMDERRPHPADLPINGGIPTTRFPEILERWLVMDHERRDARVQFSDGFSEGSTYSIARLVSSANMFDILPDNAVPRDVNLPDDLQAARVEARRLFRALPQSIERDSVLGALGRLGKANLKHKVGHRGRIVMTAAPDRFPDLIFVVEEAVNCRNHYVHGGPAKIDYTGNFFQTVPFFIDTLEFVFAASDLIEAGWEITPWLARGTTMSHPFGSYRVSYQGRLQALRGLLTA